MLLKHVTPNETYWSVRKSDLLVSMQKNLLKLGITPVCNMRIPQSVQLQQTKKTVNTN